MRMRGNLPSFSYTPCWFGDYVGFQGQLSYILLQAHLSFAELWCYQIQRRAEYRLLQWRTEEEFGGGSHPFPPAEISKFCQS
jgi:hypothetical protein